MMSSYVSWKSHLFDETVDAAETSYGRDHGHLGVVEPKYEQIVDAAITAPECSSDSV